MTLDISNVLPTDLPQLFDICSRLKSLDIRRCEMRTQGGGSFDEISDRNRKSESSAHKSTYKFLEELSISSNCGIGLSGFLSRSRRLRVLSIYDKHHRGYSEEQIMDDLVKTFRTESSMPSLQHLDLCIYRLDNDAISKVLRSVRCLRSFKCHPYGALLSIDDFQRHFSTVTTINVRSVMPEFWQKVMSSCSGLVKANGVVLFAEDIIRGEMWASTGLESLDLNVFVRSKGDVRSRSKENALFRRIATLVKLNHLSLHTGWHKERTLLPESWRILLGMKTLTSVILGKELTASQDKRDVLRRFSEKQMVLEWTEADMSLASHEEDKEEADNARLIQALSARFGAHYN